jgi:transcription elongation factor Elf1
MEVLLEDTEYLPTCGFRPIGSRRSNMQGKFLTKNIELMSVCAGSHCDHWEPVSIKELEKIGKKSCPECGAIMQIEEEFIIKD